jgi:hypothetical protein
LFRKKAKQLNEEALIEIERHRSIQDSRKFYKRLNNVRRPFEPQVSMCRVKNEELLTNKNQVLERWKEHFEEHLNKGSESEHRTRPIDLRDDGVDIFFGLLKHLQSSHLSRQTKCTIHKTLIRPVLLHSSELTKREENQLLVF